MFKGKIAIIGAGALGGFYGAKLFKNGHNVHFLLKSDYESVKKQGFKIISIHGDFEIQPPVYCSVSDIGKCDFIIISIKTTDNHNLPHLLKPIVGENSIILTLQNGLGNEEAIISALDAIDRNISKSRDIKQSPNAGKILGGTAFLCSNRKGHGVIHHTDYGQIRIADYSQKNSERIHRIAGIFNDSGIKCEVYDSVEKIRWEKLVWNIPFNGLGIAAGNADTSIIMNDNHLQDLARKLMDDVVTAAKSDGVDIPNEFAGKMINATKTMGAYKTSMQIDYEVKRPLEVEAIIGEPLKRAEKAGLNTPYLKTLYAIVKHLDIKNRT